MQKKPKNKVNIIMFLVVAYKILVKKNVNSACLFTIIGLFV